MSNSEAVTELTGTEGGVWHVHTRDSIHIFDLDAWTVERKPGPHARIDPSDTPRRLRTVERCRVGGRGHWTMESDDYLIDYYFHYTSVIQRIDRFDAEERGEEYSQELNKLGQP